MARGGRATSGVRQRKHWAGSSQISQSVTANSTFLMATAAINDPVTILRTLGEVLVALAQTGVVAGDQVFVTIGLGLFSSDAVAVGPTAVPEPSDEAEFDWLWWYGIHLFAKTGGSGADISQVSRVRLDSKAMRKVKPGTTLALVGQYEDGIGTPPVEVMSSFRVLVGE